MIHDIKKETDMTIAEQTTIAAIQKNQSGTTIKTDMTASVTNGNEITKINILARIIKRECGTTIIATRTLISWVNYWNSAKATNITRVEQQMIHDLKVQLVYRQNTTRVVINKMQSIVETNTERRIEMVPPTVSIDTTTDKICTCIRIVTARKALYDTQNKVLLHLT